MGRSLSFNNYKVYKTGHWTGGGRFSIKNDYKIRATGYKYFRIVIN